MGVSSRSSASCLVSFLRPVSRLVHRAVLSCRHPWREAVRVGRGGDVLVVMWSGRWRSVPVFLIGLTGEGHEATGVRRFIQLILIHIHGGVFVLMV